MRFPTCGMGDIMAMMEELKTLRNRNLDEAKFERRQSRTLSETLDGILRWLQKDLVALLQNAVRIPLSEAEVSIDRTFEII